MSDQFTLAPRQLNVKPRNESGALSTFVEMLNNPELAVDGNPSPDIPPELAHQAERPDSPPAEQPAPPIPPPARPANRKPVGHCLLLSGRLTAGKDYVAEKAEAKIVGFADPMYAIATYLCGVEVTSTQNKDLPGMRTFLQQVGQWGKNVVNAQYPYSAERAILIQLVRALGQRKTFGFPDVDWSLFGMDPDLWLKAASIRIAAFRDENPGKRIAITNARFENEIKFFRAIPEWDHFHVMCSLETWTERLAKKKLTPQSKEVNDYSEQVAIALDRDVYTKIKKEPRGKKLRVLWNDHRPCPSPRLWSVSEFLSACQEPSAPEF